MGWEAISVARFDEVAAAWESLNGLMGGVPILEALFVRTALQQFSGGKEYIFCHNSLSEVDCMCILAPKTFTTWETFQPSQMPLGPFLVRPGTSVAEIVPSLIRKLPGWKFGVGLSQCDPISIRRPSAVGMVRTLDYVQTASVPIDGTFDAYWGARGKNLRQNLRKQRKQLLAQGVSTRLEIISQPERVAWALAEYSRLEEKGWKSALGTAVSTNDSQGHFYRQILTEFCADGRGRIYCYWFNDQVVAMDLCVIGGRAMVILKTTYDESVPKPLSPAFLMREESFKSIFEAMDVDRIEFFGRAMEWHLRWTDQIRMLYHINGYRNSGVALAREWAHCIKEGNCSG